MAKRKKKERYVTVAGLHVPKSFVRAVGDFAQSPMGRLIIAEALVLAAGALVRKHPVATAAAAGGAAANMAGTAAEAAANFMTSAADHLKGGLHAAGGEKQGATERSGATGSKSDNGARGVWDHLDGDTVREAVMGELSRKKRKKNRAKGVKP